MSSELLPKPTDASRAAVSISSETNLPNIVKSMPARYCRPSGMKAGSSFSVRPASSMSAGYHFFFWTLGVALNASLLFASRFLPAQAVVPEYNSCHRIRKEMWVREAWKRSGACRRRKMINVVVRRHQHGIHCRQWRLEKARCIIRASGPSSDGLA